MTKKRILILVLVLLLIIVAVFSIWKFTQFKTEQNKQTSQKQQIPNSFKPPLPSQNNSTNYNNIDDDDKEVDSILKDITQEEPSADPESK